jgi:DNA-binding transcriptional MerR regulator
MYIGNLSKQTGASRKAIYLYEELGLIPTPRRQGTYRVYAPEVVGIVETIRCAQALGFTLKELAEALQPSLDDLVEQIDRKRRALQAQIDAATTRIDAATARIERLDELRQRLADAPSLWVCEKTVDSAPRGRP